MGAAEMIANSKCIFTIRPRFLEAGKERDLSQWVRAVTRNRSIESRGSWSVTLEIPATHWDNVLLMGYVRDDEWGSLDFEVNGKSSHMEILVQQIRDRMTYNSDGSAVRVWSLSGTDWTKTMDSEVRLMSLAYSLKSVTDTPTAENTAEAAAVSGTTLDSPPRIPGFLWLKEKQAFINLITQGSAGVSKAPDPANPDASVLHVSTALRKVLEMMMWGTWVDSDPSRGTILHKLNSEGWTRFGRPLVVGIPWKLKQLSSARSATPHSILQNYGCLTFNELFYDYDKETGTKPAIVYRPRPYAGTAWKKLRNVDLTMSKVTSHDLSRSGAERYDYWNPIASLVGLNGADILWDLKEGRVPLFDRTSIMRHGVRPAEPSDDFFPPMNKPSETAFKWFRNRLWNFRAWYYNNPEMLTGTVTLEPIVPELRLGEKATLPIPYKFRTYLGLSEPETIVGYVVGISETLRIGGHEASNTSSTTVQLTRVQPPDGLPLPGVWDWRRKS